MIRSCLLRASESAWIERQVRERGALRRAVRRFMPGEEPGDALREAARLEGGGVGAVLTLLGEEVGSERVAREVAQHYGRLLERARAEGLRIQLSLKPTQLGLALDRRVARDSLLRVLEEAGRGGEVVWVDMESSRYVDDTLDLYREALHGAGAPVGICLQAYLRRTPADLEGVLSTGGIVRLVKGAYREPREVAYGPKREVDRAFVALGRRLSEARPPPTGAHVLGTHDERALRRILGNEARPEGLEVHMLYGIGEAVRARLLSRDVPVRVLVSYGRHWYPWYMRRLAERPANLAFAATALLRG